MLTTFLIVLGQDMRPVKLITIPLTFLASVGIYMQYATGSTGDFDLLFHLEPWWFWSVLFSFVGVSRFVGIFVWAGTMWTRRVTPVVGIVLWSMMFASSDIASPAEGMGLLYLIPLGMETWILGRALYDEGIGL